MNIAELGKEGENQARLLLKQLGFTLTSPDWLGKKNNIWYQFEVKRKERFTKEYRNKITAPFDGHGLDIHQIERRLDLYKKNNLRPYLLIWEIGTDIWYGQWLDILESEEHFDTKNSIRVYKLSNFEVLQR